MRCHAEIRSAAPYTGISPRQTFDQVLDFVATGGYALKVYDRYARIRQRNDGMWRVSNPQVAQRYRMNVGTIVGSELLKVRLVRDRPHANSRARLMGGKVLGEIEEWFVSQLEPDDTFMFAGQILKLQGVRETDVFVSRSMADAPKVPSYQGGKFPLSTYLAERVRKMLPDPAKWQELGPQLSEWLSLAGATVRIAAARPVAGGNLSARWAALHGLLPV
jgi:ATP-dependent Lhr-like helicase